MESNDPFLRPADVLKRPDTVTAVAALLVISGMAAVLLGVMNLLDLGSLEAHGVRISSATRAPGILQIVLAAPQVILGLIVVNAGQPQTRVVTMWGCGLAAVADLIAAFHGSPLLLISVFIEVVLIVVLNRPALRRWFAAD